MQLHNNTLLKAVAKGSQANAGETDNVFTHWLYTEESGGIVHTAVVAALTAKVQAILNTLLNSVPESTEYREIDMYYKEPADNRWMPLQTVPITWKGSDVSEELPSGVAGTVTGRTGVPKRRARKFTPPLSELYNNNQQWTVLGLSRLVAYAAEWLVVKVVGFDEGFLYPVAVNVLTWAWSVVTSTVASSTPGYQRRRKPGVGR